jgi:hypothetical protein
MIPAMTFSPDMLPPGPEAEPYDVPRGSCPRCGSRRVRHHIIGFPPPPDARPKTPRWVTWEGCIHPGYDRDCRACGLTWLEDDDTPPR